MVLKNNENISKLRELTEKLCNNEFENEAIDYKEIVNEVKDIIATENENVHDEKNQANKVKCYENMCSKIKIIFNKFKIV
jgi:hypothetical protein